MASIAYSLQVGVKRHAGGSNGEIQRLYPRNNHNANFVSMVNLPFTPLPSSGGWHPEIVSLAARLFLLVPC